MVCIGEGFFVRGITKGGEKLSESYDSMWNRDETYEVERVGNERRWAEGARLNPKEQLVSDNHKSD